MTKNHARQNAWTATLTTLAERARARREAVAAHRRLRADLAAYSSPAEIDDLLAALDRAEGADVREMRAILHDNRLQYLRAS